MEHIGMDVHKRETQVCIIDAEGGCNGRMVVLATIDDPGDPPHPHAPRAPDGLG